MLSRLTIKDKPKKTRSALPAGVETVLSNLPAPSPPMAVGDVRKPRGRKPKSQTPSYIDETLGPYLADQLAELSGSRFSPEIRGAIIEFALAKVSGGMTLAQVCVEEGRCFPGKEVLYNWIMRDEELAKDFELASRMSVEARVDSVGHEVDVGADLDRVKLKFSFTKWYAAKKVPAKYGESKHLVIDQKNTLVDERIDAGMTPEEASRIYTEAFTEEIDD